MLPDNSTKKKQRPVRLQIVIGIVVAHLILSRPTQAEDGDFSYLSQRKLGVAKAEKMVLQHIVQNPESVIFRKVRYYEHHSVVDGRRALTAQVICGQIKMSTKYSVGYRRFLSWVFLDSETSRYNEDKYLIAIHDLANPDDLYAQYHSIVCGNSENGAALDTRIDVSKYQ